VAIERWTIAPQQHPGFQSRFHSGWLFVRVNPGFHVLSESQFQGLNPTPCPSLVRRAGQQALAEVCLAFLAFSRPQNRSPQSRQ
jgi:hypothetical protein